MPIACLVVPSLALACELAERPNLVGQAVALVDEIRTRVIDATQEAAGRGVRLGQTLREAVAFCPGLVVLERRPVHVARAADALVDAIAAVSPSVEVASHGLIYADLAGLDGLYPEPQMLERAVLGAVPTPLGARLGIGERRFTAYVAAQSAAPGTTLRLNPPRDVAYLAAKPAEWLPLDEDARARLHRLGLRTIGDFAALPRHAVEAQFGVVGGLAWLAARGDDPTPLRPLPFEHARVVEHAQADPALVSREAISLTMEQLLTRALRQPRASHRFVRRLRLQAVSEDDRLWERTQALKEPTGDRGRLWTAIRPLLEYAEYPGPVAVLELELGGLTAESGKQHSLFVGQARRRESLDEMIRHLKVRYGHSPMSRVVEVEPWSRLPERRHALMDYDP